MLELLDPCELDTPSTGAELSGGAPVADVAARRAVQVSITVAPWRLMKMLVVLIGLLIGLSVCAHGLLGATGEDEWRGLREIAMRFDMDRENSLPAWCSSLLLVGCGFLLAMIGTHHRRAGRAFAWHWLVLSMVFVFLSIDESLALHEISMVPLRRRLNASGFFYFAWVIAALPALACLGLAYLRFFWHLSRRTRWLFFAAACLYVGGALGMEMVGGMLAESAGFYSSAYTVVMTIEESSEMLGSSLFLCALIDYSGAAIGRQQA